jgi:hypothetical protein
MRKIEWPGITVAVAIILILTLVVLGSRDDFRLKDWQPLMATFVALAAAALTYVSAMAKADQSTVAENRTQLCKCSILRRRQRGLFNLVFAIGRILIATGHEVAGLTGSGSCDKPAVAATLRVTIRTVLDKPNYRARASLMAEGFAGIDTRSEILRIIAAACRSRDMEMDRSSLRFSEIT